MENINTKWWTPEKIKELVFLSSSGGFFFSEIAEKLQIPAGTVRHRAKLLGLKGCNKKPGFFNSKHAHLREKAMTYFLTHSFEETMEKFGLSKSNLKSLQTVSYNKKEFSHLRKDKRRHDSWSLEETLFLLKYSGLQNRKWIAERLDRTRAKSYHAVKDQLARLGIGSKYINGIPLAWVLEIFHDKQPNDFFWFKSKAGPSAPGVECRFNLVPWVECERVAKKNKIHPTYRAAFSAMAEFQKWIHGTRDINLIKRRLKKYVNQTRAI